MIFTLSDFKRIEDYFKRNGIRDSEFESVDIIDGEEYVILTKDGKNVKVLLKLILGVSPSLPGGGGTTIINKPILWKKL